MRNVLPGPHGAAVLLVAATLLASTGCGPRAEDRPECSVGRSTLSGIAPGSGRVLWTAQLDLTSERPLLVQDGTAVVTAPCGAAVVDLEDGEVLHDDATPGNLVGVAGRQLFTLDETVMHDPPAASRSPGSTSTRPAGAAASRPTRRTRRPPSRTAA